MNKKKITNEDLEKAKRLRNVRISNRLTQEEMAEKLDIAYSVYQRMENGRNNITITHLTRLRKMFGTSADYILFGDVNDERHYEFEFEGMNENTQFMMITRLMAHLCKLNQSKCDRIMEEIEKVIK